MTRSVEKALLESRIDDARTWLFHQALPLWSTIGVDGEWGFVEELTLAGTPAEVGYKRLRVQARQVYVFSHAAMLGFPAGRDAAANGWRFMRDHAWLETGGWARRVDPRGKVLDDTLDLYDQAFALFAAAWWAKLSGEAEPIEFAHRTLDAIDARLTSPTGRGWISEDGPASAHLQNPHMHLLEAMLALSDVSPDERFVRRAADILGLFETTLFDERTGTIAEYYDADWNRSNGVRGRIVEPGHHYEWVWLLHSAAHVTDAPLGTAERLFDFAERWGSGSGGAPIYDELLDDGTLHRDSYRAWPQTEALKAHLAVFESTGELQAGRVRLLLDAVLTTFLGGPVAGAWIDRTDSELLPASTRIPASTLYHLVVAITELLRVEPALRAAESTD